MVRKGIYLFSVAILGCSLMPSTVWADEAAAPAASNVSTEFVESSSNVLDPAAVAAETPQINEPVNNSEAVEAEAIPPESTELTAPEVTEPESTVAEEPAEPVEVDSTEAVSKEEVAEEKLTSEESEPSAPITQENSEPNGEKEAEPTVEAETTQAAMTALKDDDDGKIVDHEKAVTDENAKVPAEYEFMPNFANVKDVIIGGTTNYVSDGYTYTFDLDTEDPDTITVTYKNVGTYKGKVIDMKITVKGWTALAGKQVLHINRDNGITMQGIRDVLLNYSFFDNLTAAPVKLSGFFNFTDIDLEQSVDLFNKNNIQNFYVTKNNQLYYKTHGDYIKIGEIDNINTTNFDMSHWLAFTYKNVFGFDVRYNQDYETDAVFNYSFKLPFIMRDTPGFYDPSIPKDVEMPDEPNSVGNNNQGNTSNAGTVSPAITASETVEVTTGAQTTVQSAAQTAPAAVIQTTQAELPKTNVKKGSFLTILGGACIVLFAAIFLNKKKA